MKIKIQKQRIFFILSLCMVFEIVNPDNILAQNPPASGPVRFGYTPLPQIDLPTFSSTTTPNQTGAASPMGQTQSPHPSGAGPSVSRRMIESNKREVLFLNGRSVFLNGTDISSLRNQALDNVAIMIDDSGNVMINAPQYEVSAEETFHPLLQEELPKFDKYEAKFNSKEPFEKNSGKSQKNEPFNSPLEKTPATSVLPSAPVLPTATAPAAPAAPATTTAGP